MEELTVDVGESSAVVLLYGEATDYVLECAGVSQSHEHLPSDYSHLENTVSIMTNMERAADLPETVYGLM